MSGQALRSVRRLLSAGARNKAEHHARVRAKAASLGLADPYGGAS